MIVEFSKLHIRNISAFSKAKVDFSKLNFCLIKGIKNIDGVDNNGACKTGVFDVPTWVLYDMTAKGVSKDYMIREGEKNGEASVWLTDGEDEYKVTRTRGNKGNKLFIELNGEEITEKFATQKKVEDMIGMDFKSFVSSSYFGQNDINNFCSGTNSQRTAIIEGIVTNIRRIDALQAIVGKEYARLSSVIQDINISISSIEKVTSDFDISDAKKELKKRIKKKAKKENELERHSRLFKLVSAKIDVIRKYDHSKTSLNEYRAEVDNRLSEYDADLERLKEQKAGSVKPLERKLKLKQDKLSDFEQEVKQANDEYANTESNYQTAVSNYRDIDLQLKKNKLKIGMNQSNNDFDSVKMPSKPIECPSCHMVLDGKSFSKILEECRKLRKKSENALKKVDICKKKNGKAYDKLARAKKNRNSIERGIEKIKAGIRAVRGLAERIKEDIERVKEREAKVRDDARRHIRYLNNEIIKYEKMLNNMSDIDVDDNQFNDMQIELKRLVAEVEKESAIVRQLDKDIKKYESLKDDYEKAVLTRKKLVIEQELCEYCNKHFPKMKIFTIGSILPDINDQLKSNLESLKFDFDVTFKVGRELKRGDIKDELDIEIVNMTTGHKRIWKQLSGGEQQRISLATYLSLNSLSNFNMIFMDEVLRNMDDTGRKLALDLLYAKSQSGKKIFVIDHLKDIENLFEQSIIVKNIDGVATIG